MKQKIGAFLGSPWGQRSVILAIILVIMGIFQRRFFLGANLSSILLAIAIYGIMAAGMLFTVLVGGMDLSVGSMAGLAASITYLFAQSDSFSNAGFLKGFLAAMLVCVVVGYFHGTLVTAVGIPAFVVTLATKYILTGTVQLVTGGRFVNLEGTGLAAQIGNAKVAGIPMPVIILFAYIIICSFVLMKTTFGRRLYAIGGNSVASRLVGIKTSGNIKIAYIVSSVSAGIGGIVLGSLNMIAGQTTAMGYEGNVLMAMVVGGINLAGGEGGVPGAIFGALLVGVINNVMNLLGVSSDFQKFVQGIIILAAVILNMYTKRRSQGLVEQRGEKKAKA